MSDKRPQLRHVARERLERRVALHHLAFFRAALEGLDLATVADRYLEFGPDPVQARRTLQWIKAELIAACRRAKPHYARLLKVPYERYAGADVETGPYQNLEDFRAAEDPSGFYSEAELIEIFKERQGNPDPKARRRAERNARLRKKLQEALSWLEGYLPVDALPSDPVGVWLDEQVAERLVAAGIQSMADLGRLIARRGSNWHRDVARIGPETASRIESWLSGAKLMPDTTLLPSRDNPPPPSTDIVPLERFKAPSALNGSDGSNRAYGTALGAQNDYDALGAWLASLGDSPHTVRSYRAHAERFMLWMIFEKGKPLSSATTEDCTNYRDWLEALGQLDQGGVGHRQEQLWYWVIPVDRWVGTKKVPRFSPEWRPFCGPLSPRSQKLSITILTALCEWLTRQRYLGTNPWDGVAPIAVDARLRTDHALTSAQWHTALAACADIPVHSTRVRMRFLLLAAYGLGLRLSELAAMKVAKRVEDRGRPNFGLRLEPSGEGWELVVLGKGRKIREVAVPQATMDALCDYMAARGLGADPRGWPEQVALLVGLGKTADKALSTSGIYRLLEVHFRRAARRADNRADADRLLEASTHWLRHTHVTHALAAGVPIDVVQEGVGHASQATTALYTHAGRRRRRAGAEKLMGFVADRSGTTAD